MLFRSRVGQGGTVACEALVGILEQFLVLFREAAAGFPVDCLHAGEEFGVERDVVRQFGQLGLHAQCDLLHFVRRIRFEQVEEDTRDTIQQRTVALQSHDGIAEGRLRGVGDDRVDLGIRAGDGRVERRLVDVVPFVGVTAGLVRRYGKFRAVPGLDAGVQVKLKVASSLYLYAEPKVGIRTDTYDGSEQGRPDRVASMVGGLLYRFKMPTFQ